MSASDSLFGERAAAIGQPVKLTKPATPRKLAICVVTCQRPVLLAQLLESLNALILDTENPVDLRVIIVDNDDSGRAQHLIDGWRGRLRWPILYEVEPVRNISLARNKSVALALAADADFLAFIDDDEIAPREWITELLNVQRKFAADVVWGPVFPRFESPPADWIIKGGFFLRHRRLPTGTIVATAETSNVLVSAPLVSRVGWFDPSYGRSGGGDSHFFLRARLLGARIVWADAAGVEELLPASRVSVGWILQRAFRIGNCGVKVYRSLLPFVRWFPERLAKSVVRIGIGTSLLIASLFLGKAAAVKGLWHIALSLGALTGMVGFRYLEYRQIHGR